MSHDPIPEIRFLMASGVAVAMLAAWCQAGEPTSTTKVPLGTLDRAAAVRELTDFSLEGMDHRLGPGYAFYHRRGPEERFPKVWMPQRKHGAEGRYYQIGGPWTKEAGDYSSTQGQVLYVPDKGFGVDRVTIIEWAHGCWTESPEPPWWGGFRPEPASANWQEAAKGDPGAPIMVARGMGSWANCGVLVFSSGLVATAGTCTAKGANPTFQFPAHKIPTAVAVTNKNEFALVTVCDVRKKKGQVAVLALEGSGKQSGFAHDWPDAHPCVANVAFLTQIKLLGYVDLPGMEFPTGVTAVGNRQGGRVNGLDGHAGMLREFDLARQPFRDMFLTGSNAHYSSTAGFAVVISKHEGKAAFLDLQPLFQRVCQMYFTTEQNYRKTRNSGLDPKQWPYAFDVDPTWKPSLVTVLDVPRPTAVIASMSGGDKARGGHGSEPASQHPWREDQSVL